MKKMVGYVLGFIGIFIAMLMAFAGLWCVEIARWQGIARFMQAYTYEGHFFAPPAFWLILIFYNHFFVMLLAFLAAAGLFTWIGERMIGDEEINK